MGIYDKDIERLSNAEATAKMIIKELNKKNYKSNGGKQIKVAGISGRKDGYSFGTIDDLEIAINSWIGRNQDKTIIDIKVMLRGQEGLGDYYDALISYNKICTKDEYLNKEK